MKQQIKGFLAVLLLGSILSTGCTGPEDVPSSGGLPPDSMDGHAILRVVRLLPSLRGNRRNPKKQEYPSCIPM